MIKRITLLSALVAVSSANGALIAHYTFDDDGTDSGTSGGTATLGGAGSIDKGNYAVGSGSLSLSGTPGTDTSGADGAVSANSFTWTTDTRTVAFWVQVGTQTDSNPTMISLGGGAGTGTRYDIRLTAGGALRLEVQSGFSDTTAILTGGDWYHVTVTNGDGATVGTTTYFVHDQNANLVYTGNFSSGTEVNTGTGPLRVGDSYQDIGRDFVGNIDDVRLYDEVFNQSQAQALATQFVPEPSSTALIGLAGLGFIIRRKR